MQAGFSLSDASTSKKSAEIATTIEPEKTMDFGLTIYPNPTKGDVIIQFESPINQSGELIVKAINGQEVLRKEFLETNRIDLDLKDQVSGFYLIIIKTSDQVYTRKLILKHQ